MSNLFNSEYEDVNEADIDHLTPSDPFPPPKENGLFVSEQTIEKEFIDFVSKDKVPHAVILSGIKGIGKATFAYRIARFLLTYGKSRDFTSSLFGDADAPVELPENMNMDRESPVFRRIISGGHADFLSLEPVDGKKGLDVQQIRKVAPFLRKTASEDGGWRIVLIDDADTMNRNAQNALLKILEEPPSRTLLLLVSHNSGSFLPTIHSRCRIISVLSPGFDTYKNLLHQKDPHLSKNDIDILYQYSSGSIGKTIQFLDFDGLDLLKDITGHLGSFPKADFEKIHLFCDSFGRANKEQQWQNFGDLMIWIFQNLALHKARGQTLPDSLQDIEPLNSLWSLEEQLEICQMLESKIKRAHFSNLDKRETALEIFMILQQQMNNHN